LISSESKDIYNKTKIFFLNKCCAFRHQIILIKFITVSIKNIKQHSYLYIKIELIIFFICNTILQYLLYF